MCTLCRIGHAKTAALQYRHENKIGFVLSEQEKFKDQLEQATEKARLFEYLHSEKQDKRAIRSFRQDASLKIYTEERIPIFGKGI